MRRALSFSLFVLGALWGMYTLLAYLGVPAHESFFWTNEPMDRLGVVCGTDQSAPILVCRGAFAFFPFLSQTLRMISPFFTYIIVCVLGLLGMLGYTGYKTGRFRRKVSLRPLTIVPLFGLSLWLFATTLSLGSLDNLNTPENARVTDEYGETVLMPVRRVYEPRASPYRMSGPAAIQQLRNDFRSLQDRACLRQTRLGPPGGPKIYDLTELCVQESIFVRVGAQFILVLAFLFTLLALGRFVLVRVLGLSTLSLLATAALSFGSGALALTALLWLLSILGVLRMFTVWALLAGLHIALFRQGKWWAEKAWQRSITVECSLKNPTLLLGWLLVSYLALNFLSVVRPFPIGWDDLTSYLDRPRLLSSYGAFNPSMSQFQWEYLTSLGYVLFGSDSTVGATFAMEINWTQGLVAALTVFVFARTLLGSRAGMFAAVLYSGIPMVGHFSFVDMKVDNSCFFTTGLAMLALLLALTPDTEQGQMGPRERRSLLILSGLLIGFSLAIKATAILGWMLLFSILCGWHLGVAGFIGSTIFGFGVLQFGGALNMVEVFNRAALPLNLTQRAMTYSTLGIGGVCLGYSLLKAGRPAVQPWIRSLGVFVVGTVVACLPWMTWNAFLNGKVSMDSVLKAEERGVPQVSHQPVSAAGQGSVAIRSLPRELSPDPANPACTGSAKVEEFDRYWGSGSGFSSYLTLPWRQVMNADVSGYYVTLMPALLLFPLLLLLPFFWFKEARFLRLLFAGSWTFLVAWAFSGNGVCWYGIGMFLGLVVALEALVVHAPDGKNRCLFSVLLGISLVICLTSRVWAFDQQKILFEYPIGKISADALRKVDFPYFDIIRESVASRHQSIPDRPYTYRIGTEISYFIPRHREVFPELKDLALLKPQRLQRGDELFTDQLMLFFNCIDQEHNHALTLKRLQTLGFNSIIFDTRTSGIEQDANGPLHKRVDAFQAFSNDSSLGLRIAINDPDRWIVYVLLP